MWPGKGREGKSELACIAQHSIANTVTGLDFTFLLLAQLLLVTGSQVSSHMRRISPKIRFEINSISKTENDNVIISYLYRDMTGRMQREIYRNCLQHPGSWGRLSSSVQKYYRLYLATSTSQADHSKLQGSLLPPLFPSKIRTLLL